MTCFSIEAWRGAGRGIATPAIRAGWKGESSHSLPSCTAGPLDAFLRSRVHFGGWAVGRISELGGMAGAACGTIESGIGEGAEGGGDAGPSTGDAGA